MCKTHEKTDIGNTQFTSKAKTYQRRKPENTVFYQVIQENFATYQSLQSETDQAYNIVTSHVQNEINKLMSCGILAHGFARAKCECGEDFLIAFSCKGKLICPSCNTCRMHETTANLVDNVFPKVPSMIRVLSTHFNKIIQINKKRCFLYVSDYRQYLHVIEKVPGSSI